MGDKFHKSHCGLRHGGTACTCGYVAPKTDKQIIEELRTAKDEAEMVMLNVMTNDEGSVRRINEWIAKWCKQRFT